MGRVANRLPNCWAATWSRIMSTTTTAPATPANASPSWMEAALAVSWFTPETVFGLPAAIAALQLIRWGYRSLAMNYRITTQKLVHHRGRLYGRAHICDLAMVSGVQVTQNLLGRLLGVGDVHI